MTYTLVALIVSLGICLVAAGLGSMITRPALPGWYDALRKPRWTPPDSTFPTVWTLLFALMGVAAWVVWKQPGAPPEAVRLALAFFFMQLLLNVGWSFVFFRLQKPGWAFAEILLLWAAIALTANAFWNISVTAGALLLPYLVWVGFAAALNFAIWRMNPQA